MDKTILLLITIHIVFTVFTYILIKIMLDVQSKSLEAVKKLLHEVSVKVTKPKSLDRVLKRLRKPDVEKNIDETDEIFQKMKVSEPNSYQKEWDIPIPKKIYIDREGTNILNMDIYKFVSFESLFDEYKPKGYNKNFHSRIKRALKTHYRTLNSRVKVCEVKSLRSSIKGWGIQSDMYFSKLIINITSKHKIIKDEKQ